LRNSAQSEIFFTNPLKLGMLAVAKLLKEALASRLIVCLAAAGGHSTAHSTANAAK
jgi:hypothetical protein